VRWFEALPAERRAEFERSHREGLRRDDLLARQSRRRVARDVLQTTLLFLVADQVAPHASAGSVLAALVSGVALGLVCLALNADRVLTGALGCAAFFLLQWLSRGGLTGLHLFLFMPVGAVCVYLGWRREEREYDA
jgi:hypothetical protein